MACLSLASAAQTPARPSAEAQAAAPHAGAPATQTFTNAELHLTFTYPSELKPMDPGTLPGAGRNAAFAGDPDAESDDLLTGHCSHVLLSVGKTAESREGGMWGSILLVAIEPACLPAKTLKSRKAMDNLLNPLVTGATQILGMAPVGPAAAYPVEGYRVHIAESEGQPVVKGDLQPNEAEQTMAVLAVQVNDHVLAWKIESNNAGLLNRMLASQVDFGLGTPQPLFPLQMPGKVLPP